MKTSKIKLRVLANSKNEPIVLTVPASKVKELRAVGRAAEKQGVSFCKALEESSHENHEQISIPSDTDMLDWLDKQGRIYDWSVQLPSDYPNVQDCVFICRNNSSGYKTIREAILNKMKG